MSTFTRMAEDPVQRDQALADARNLVPLFDQVMSDNGIVGAPADRIYRAIIPLMLEGGTPGIKESVSIDGGIFTWKRSGAPAFGAGGRRIYGTFEPGFTLRFHTRNLRVPYGAVSITVPERVPVNVRRAAEQSGWQVRG